MRLAVLFLTLLSTTAVFADTKYKCDISGKLDKDALNFTADYTAKPDKKDVLAGVYTNPADKSNANVGGTVSGGRWSIQLIYTDDAHKNQTTNLSGSGKRDDKANTISITGKFETRVRNKVTKSGDFTLAGKCKKA